MLAVAAVLVAGCGSDDDGDRSQPAVNSTVASTVGDPSTTAGSPTETAGASEPALGPGSPIAVDGVGPIRVGMTVDEAQRAAGIPMTRNDGPRCRSLSPSDRSLPVDIVAEDGDQVNLVTVSSGPIKTAAGIGIGSTEEQVVAAYPGGTEVLPGAPGPHRVILRQRGRAMAPFSLVFQIDEGTVSQMRAGLRDRTEADENCA